MNISLISHTKNAVEMLIFTKRTRLMTDASSFADVFELSEEEKLEELESIFATISSPLEFVEYTFLISGVTRAFTHQLVRSRIGTSFAQQSLRVALDGTFDYEATGDANTSELYHDVMDGIRDGYQGMLDAGIAAQDARGILPTNIHTNICFKINLRALLGMMGLRMCVRTQGEYQDVAYRIRELVLEIHPWAAPVFLPYCLQTGACFFPHFDECPIKDAHPGLQPFTGVDKAAAIRDWRVNIGSDIQPVAKFANKEDS